MPRRDIWVLGGGSVPFHCLGDKPAKDSNSASPAPSHKKSCYSFGEPPFSRAPLGISHPVCFPREDAMKLTPRRESARKTDWRALALSALFALLNSSCGASALPNPPAPHQQSPLYFVTTATPAPEFQLAGLDGKPISLADARGKIILLNFWASWCGPCRAEVPDLVDLQTRYKDRLQVIGLIVDDDDMDAIHQLVKEFGINYPLVVAPAE